MRTWISWSGSRRRSKWHVQASPNTNVPPGTTLCNCSAAYGLKVETVTVKPEGKFCKTCELTAKKLEAP